MGRIEITGIDDLERIAKAIELILKEIRDSSKGDKR